MDPDAHDCREMMTDSLCAFEILEYALVETVAICIPHRGEDRLLRSKATDLPGEEQIQHSEIPIRCATHKQRHHLPGLSFISAHALNSSVLYTQHNQVISFFPFVVWSSFAPCIIMPQNYS